MKRITVFTCVAALGLIGGVAAQVQPARTERGQAVYDIVLKWGGHVSEAYKVNPSVWAKRMESTFANASIPVLKRAANAKTFDSMNNILIGKPTAAAASGNIKPQVIGDADKDLVFVPISPCRVFDTRVAGGIIAADSVRDIDITAVANYSFQGGDASNCSGAGAAGSFAAVAINFTSVAPAQTGFFTAYPFLTTRPLAATQVFNAGQVLSNYAVVRLDQGASASELSIYSERALHLVGDMVGYYIEATKPAAALECVDTAQTSVSVNASATANAVAPACAAGYTQTGTNCESSTWQMPFVYFNGGTCSAQNNSASTATLRASRTCCRVPAL